MTPSPEDAVVPIALGWFGQLSLWQACRSPSNGGAGAAGPDGGGKTTLFRILATLMVLDMARAVLGRDVVKDIWISGVVSHSRALSLPDPAHENPRFFAAVFERP
jgi:ABC-type multidrug transport system ATPase subunit